MTMTTTNGTVYEVDGLAAWPLRDPQPPLGNNYNSSLDWGRDTAIARGMLVDASISRGDNRVRNAGPEWMEVYNYLRVQQ